MRFGLLRRRQIAAQEPPLPPHPSTWPISNMTVTSSWDLAQQRLEDSLTLAQQQSIRDNSWFEVISNHGNRWRIVTNRITGNVFLMAQGGDYHRQYCTMIRSIESFPPADLYLAQALTLATDEASFVDVAVALLGGGLMVIRYQSPQGDTLLDNLTDEQVAVKFEELTAHGFRAFADTKVADPIGPVKSLTDAEELGAKELFFIAPLQGG